MNGISGVDNSTAVTLAMSGVWPVARLSPVKLKIELPFPVKVGIAHSSYILKLTGTPRPFVGRGTRNRDGLDCAARAAREVQVRSSLSLIISHLREARRDTAWTTWDKADINSDSDREKSAERCQTRPLNSDSLRSRDDAASAPVFTGDNR